MKTSVRRAATLKLRLVRRADDQRLTAKHARRRILSLAAGAAAFPVLSHTRLVLIATLLSSPASAEFYSYNDFDRQPPALKYLYVAGAVDMFLAIQASGAKRFDVGECIRDAKISIKQITENMQAYAKTRPELQNGTVETPLLGYLAELCPASKDIK
jgi:hypothetical protein